MTPLPRDVSVLVPAAGAGERLGLGPKALLPLAGRPVLDWVLDKARCLGDEMVVALPAGAAAPAGCHALVGGATRQESVHRLVRAASRPWVLVWDAARPFGSVALAREVLTQAAAYGAAAATEPSGLPQPFQTPLGFRRELLLEVADRAAREGWVETSTMALVLRAGKQAARVPGEAGNIKLTTPQDWERAQSLSALLVL